MEPIFDDEDFQIGLARGPVEYIIDADRDHVDFKVIM